MEATRETLAARLVIMGKAQDVLISGSADEADIALVLNAALEPHVDDQRGRFRLRGPRLHLNPRAALSLALLVHELATKAVKYGALSASGRYVDLVWAVTGETPPCLTFGGRNMAPPGSWNQSARGSAPASCWSARWMGRSISPSSRRGVKCTVTAPLAGLTCAR